MPAWPHGDPSAVVRSILATSPYRRAPRATLEKPKKTLLELLGDWIHDNIWIPIRHFFHSLHLYDPHASAGNAGRILVYALIAAAAAVLVYVIYRLALAFGRPKAGGVTDRGDRVASTPPSSSKQWRARAAELARAGDYARAVAALFTASLATLDERTIVTFDATRTPGEYRRLVRRERRSASEAFNDLASRFVRAAYAEVTTTADDYAAAERAFAAFEPAAV